MDLQIPKKLEALYTTKKRYVVIHGGRGSGKSWGVAQYIVLRCYKEAIRVLCTREIQASIEQSVHKLLSDTITSMGLGAFFTITEKSIKGKNGSEIFFKGLYNNHDSVKSLENIKINWTEEAQSVSRKSISVLTPTIRADDSMLIFTINPENDDDVIMEDYIIPDRNDTLKIELNFNDNPFFPTVLKDEMEYCRTNDADAYAHIWCGKTIKHSAAQIFNGKWKIKDFDLPSNTHYYFGADFGFSQDPSTLVKVAIQDKDLYICNETGQVGVEIVNLPVLYDTVCSKNDLINADNSRPETISHMKREGYNVVGRPKLGIEDGIEYMRAFENIYVHPKCAGVQDELRLYCYKIDNRSGQITNTIVDKHNHYIDAIRYALYDCIRKKKDEYVSIIRY